MGLSSPAQCSGGQSCPRGLQQWPDPLFLLGFISRLGVNFLIYYPLCLSFPLFVFILLCLEETPAPKNQPPEAKAKPDTPSASASLPGQTSPKKHRICTEDRTHGEGIFMPKLPLKQNAGLLVF